MLLLPPLGPFPTLSDLQHLELCGGSKETLWELCQLVVIEIPARPK